jgi:hypothetical protein
MVTYCTTSDVARNAGLVIASLPSNITEANITSHIEDAEAMIDRFCNTKFASTSVTEYYDGNDMRTLMLRHFPVISVTSLSIRGTSITVATKLHIYTGMEGAGKITLDSEAEVSTFESDIDPKQITVVYTYGYASVPAIIKKATANVAARALLIQQVGGTYDDVTTMAIPEMSASLGEPWTQIRETLQRLKDEWNSEIFPYLPKVPAMA